MLLQLSQLLMHGAAMLDFEVGVLGGCPSSDLRKSEYKWNALLDSYSYIQTNCLATSIVLYQLSYSTILKL